MALGIFGGTFNPPHLGHLQLVRAFADRLNLRKVLIIPTFQPPHKESLALASTEDRLSMCRRLFLGDERFFIDTMEIDRGGKSYTVDTLEALREKYPDEKLYLIIGSDMLDSFHTWYRVEDIYNLCTVCAAPREDGYTLHSERAILMQDFHPIEVSSTEIRERIRQGEDVSDVVGQDVMTYIHENKLFFDGYTQYRILLRRMLGEYRLRHSFCVADSARYLAEKYGEDPEKAYLAGLLHDVMKDTPKEEQLQFMEKSGVSLTPAERFNPKLWHAMAGEAFLRTKLSIRDADILNAVRFHTTGRGEMSLLEKIIYIADYISEDRSYDGVEKMRALSEKSLEDAMWFGLTFTITDLAEKGQVIHPDSVDCYNSICISK